MVIPVLRGIVIIIGIVTLGILIFPVLIVLSFVEDYIESDERKEKMEDKKERSKGRGLFVRY